MIDSCRPRKLDPGLAATYSKPIVFSTSTMKSEPLRWLSRRTCTSPGPIASPAAVMMGVVGPAGAGEAGRAGEAGGDDCPASSALEPTSAAAPASALFCRNSRRSSPSFFDFLDLLTPAPPNRASWRDTTTRGYDLASAHLNRAGRGCGGDLRVRVRGAITIGDDGPYGRRDAWASHAGLPYRCAMRCAVHRDVRGRAEWPPRHAVSVRRDGSVHCLLETGNVHGRAERGRADHRSFTSKQVGN